MERGTSAPPALQAGAKHTHPFFFLSLLCPALPFLALGVLQVEAMAQLGGIVMMDAESAADQQNFFFGGIEGCKFRRPVVPGDTLMMHVTLTKFNKRFGIAKMAAKAFIGEDMCCEAELTLVMAKGA